jgi:hypothetical protein
MSRLLRSQRVLLPFALAWVSMLALWAPVWAQQSELRVAEVTVDEETLSVTVEGPSGLDEFAASVDGVAADATIEGVSGTPSTIVFAVETSSSMAQGGDVRALEAVRTVIDGLPEGDSVALVTFGTEVEVLVPPTEDQGAIVEALAEHEGSLAASLYTGVHTAFSLTAFSEAPSSVVLITRGWNFSGSASKTSAEALAAAEASGAAGFVVALGSDLDAKFLDAVAALGGLPRGSDSVGDLASISAAIEARRGSSYELVVPLAGLEGGAHELLLSAAGLQTATSFETIAVAPPPVVPTEAPTPAATAPLVSPTEAPTAAATASPIASPEVVAPVEETDLVGGTNGERNLRVDQLIPAAAAVAALMALTLLIGYLALWRRMRRRRRQGAVSTRLGVGSYDTGTTEADRGRVAGGPVVGTFENAVATAGVRDEAAGDDESRGAPIELTASGAVHAVLTVGRERHEFSIGAMPTTVGSSPQADVHLDAPGAPFIHSVLGIEDGRPVAILLAGEGEAPQRIVLNDGVPTDLGGARLELHDGTSAAA